MNVLRVLVASVPLFVAPLVAVGQGDAPSTSGADTASQPVMAVWVEKEINFPYKGLTSYYTCTGIENKVSEILRAIGARPGFKVTARSCIRDAGARGPFAGVEPMPWVYIRAAMPYPATPELLAQLAKPDAKKELVAKTNGQSAAAPEATAQFPAQWKQIRLLGSQLGPVQQGDCELVDEMARDAFVQLGTKIIENHMACVPKQVNPGSIRLTLEVLQPVPAKK
jgi:hypothetical protein